MLYGCPLRAGVGGGDIIHLVMTRDSLHIFNKVITGSICVLKILQSVAMVCTDFVAICSLFPEKKGFTPCGEFMITYALYRSITKSKAYVCRVVILVCLLR